MELQPRPSDGQPREPPEYQSLDDRRVTQDYYNMGVSEESLDEKGEIYENVEWNGSVLQLKKVWIIDIALQINRTRGFD